MTFSTNHLNPEQRAAVLHGSGPLLILAGAGSGKTSTMAYRMAHLIRNRHVSALQILGLSFTNKAAQELKDRVRRLVIQSAGPQQARGLTITTFHSLCVRILRKYADRIGFPKNFLILDSSDQIDVIRQILKNIRLDERRFDPQTLLFQISRAKNAFLSKDAAERKFLEQGGFSKLSSDYSIATASCYSKYLTHLQALGAMDFDDLIFHTVRLLQQHADVRAHYNALFTHILVDEYQDTNEAQFTLLRLLTERQQNLCVVGDDDQSIYAWRGADPSHILGFTHLFPDARVITLNQNYRSTSTILNAANQVISKNRIRHAKTLWSDRGDGDSLIELISENDREEAELVADEISKFVQQQDGAPSRTSRSWKDFAILYRSNTQSRLFEEALRMRRIPYKIVGSLSFLDRKEVKDVLSYLRLAIHPADDTSIRRVINWPQRGIGKNTLQALNEFAFQKNISLYEAMSHAQDFAPRSVSAIQDFIHLIQNLNQTLELTQPEPAAVAQWAISALDRIGVKAAILEENENPAQAEVRSENAVEIANAIGQLRLEELREQTSSESISSTVILQEYLSRLALQAQDDEEENKTEKDSNQVTLLTLHGAKGLEYPIVFLVGLEEGLLPHRRVLEEATDLAEERRLCYVGITRARDQLYLSRAKNRIRFGKAVPRHASRFLEDIPKDLIITRDESSGPDLSSPAIREEHENRVTRFLDQIKARLSQ